MDSVQHIPKKEPLSQDSQEREILDKIRDFFKKQAWYQLTIRGVKGSIKEINVTETKHYD